jgi:hypothetical protein
MQEQTRIKMQQKIAAKREKCKQNRYLQVCGFYSEFETKILLVYIKREGQKNISFFKGTVSPD